MQTEANNIFDFMGLSQSEPSKLAKPGLLGIDEQTGATSHVNSEAVPFDMIFGALMAKNPDLLPVIDANNVVLSKPSVEQTEEFVQSVLQANIKDLVQQSMMNLPEGRYEVLDSVVNAKSVDMLLTDSNGKQVQISVPLDAFQNLNMMNRINVETSAQNKQLASLLEQMHVKEITVNAVASEQSLESLRPLEISLVGENQGNEIVLKAKVKQHQLLSKSLTSSNLMEKPSQQAAMLDESGIWNETSDSDDDVTPKFFGTDNLKNQMFKIARQETFKQFGSQKINVETGAVNRLDAILQQSAEVDQTMVHEKSEVSRPVRMQLPENLKTMLRPNGQEVTIRINPENLGPAKLSLKFHDDKLTARLMVTSVHAKELLENSVSRLIDQLHKVDINVDKIDITLSGEEKQHEQFDRRNEFNRRMSFRNLHNEDPEFTDAEQNVYRWVGQNNGYLTTRAVNLLA